MRPFVVCFIGIVVSCSSFISPARCENGLLNSLISQGIRTGEGDLVVKLPEPSLRNTLSADEQRKAIEQVYGDSEIDRFLKKSVVSPFELKISSVGKMADGGQIQQLDLWFVAHGKLADIKERKLFEELAIPSKKKANGPVEEARALTDEEVKERKLKSGKIEDGSQVSYGLLKTVVLEKAYLTLMTYSQGESSDDELTMAFQNDAGLKDDNYCPTRWYKLSNELVLGDRFDYTVAAAYAKATRLKFDEEAILVEIHLVFAEPYGWFEGRNLLRSKLPPLLQDAVRTFRRKLAG